MINKIKKILSLLLVIITSIFLVSCDTENITVRFLENDIEINIDEQYELQYKVTEGYDIYFVKNEDDIIEIENNYIIPLKEGKTIVKIFVEGYNIFDTINVSITNKEIETEDIYIKGPITGVINSTIQLDLEFIPYNATNKNVEWFSTDKSIATVDNGLVTLLNLGEVTIYITQNNITTKHLINVTDEEIILENGFYTSKDDVAIYIYLYHKLPANYITKEQVPKGKHIKDLWTKDNMLSIGGDIFYNRERLLPIKNNRIYYEVDIDYEGGNRNAKRIVYSNDYLIFYTDDHYGSFVMFDWETKTWNSY